MINHYDGYSGTLILTMPEECAEDCSGPGEADGAVAHWLNKVTWHADEEELRRICRETGAWEDWATDAMDLIKGRVLWMACCDWRENNSEGDRDSYADSDD